MIVLGGLLPLLVTVGLAYGVYRLVAAQRQGGPGAGSGPAGTDGDLRDQVVRLFRLGLLFIALGLSAEGITGLLVAVLPRSDELARDPAELAQALSFTIVGVPALAGLARWTRRRLAADPGEAASPVWAGYLTLALLVALVVTTTNLTTTLQWLFGVARFDGGGLARSLVWGAVLAVHWVLSRRRPLVDVNGAAEARTPWYLVIGSLVGLVAGGSALAGLADVSLRMLYDAAVDHDVLVGAGTDPVLRALASSVPAVAVWVWIWLGHTLRAPRTERWYAYVLLAGVLGGLGTTLIAGGQLVFSVLQWLFGDPPAATAAAHFASLPGPVAALGVGGVVWIHHRHTLATASRHRSEVDRIYTYLLAFVGVVVCTVAVTLVVAAFVEAVVGAGLAGSLADPIVLAVTFLAIGVPLWAVFWRRAEANARADRSEVRSPSRRLYLLVTLGLSAAVALVSLVVLLTGFLTDLTAGDLAGATARRIRVPLGLVLSTAAVAAYHGVVYRDDRRSTAPPPPPERRVREVVLISDLTPADAAAVAESLGGRVVRYTTANGVGPRPDDEAVGRAAEATAALTTGRALVTVRHGEIEVEALQD
ncbi:MAG: DUF5671 domain-containing protein [Acidimicrobiales bacterium]